MSTNSSKNQPQAAPPTSFHKFSDLPSELRLQIWRHVLPEPRIVQVEPKELNGGTCSRVWSNIALENNEELFFDTSSVSSLNHSGRRIPPQSRSIDYGPLPCFALRTCEPIPVLLITCKESHDICLEDGYEQAFRTLGDQAGIWFNFRLDTLYFTELAQWRLTRRDRDLPSTVLGTDISKVQNLALGEEWASYKPRSLPIATSFKAQSVCRILRWFGGVKNLTFCIQEHDASESIDLVLKEVYDMTTALDHYSQPYSLHRENHEKERKIDNELYLGHIARETAFIKDKLKARFQHERMMIWETSSKYPRWTMPVICRKNIVSENALALLKKLEMEWWAARKDFSTTLNVWCGELPSTVLTVNHETTVFQVMQDYWTSSGIPILNAYAYYYGMRLKVSEKILSVPRMGQNDTLEIRIA